jgi:hypothetical protein
MNQLNNYRYYLLLAVLLPTLAWGAQPTKSAEAMELSKIWRPLTQVQNAAMLGISGVQPHGMTELGYSSESGEYHRAQEGNARNGLNFYSERYDVISKNWVSWGSFNFIMDREENRRWSDVIHTYNNNPYIYGSSVPANYDRQLFDFKAKISSRFDSPWNIGLGIDYQVGDLSRLRDPRTRVFLADYAALPGVTFRLNTTTSLGLNLLARYQKEKMPNVTTVQDDPNLAYYTFSGMENADAVVSGFKGFQRQFVSTFYGGDVQYSFENTRNKMMISAGAFYQHQDILENIRQSPGTFRSLNYRMKSIFTQKTNDKLLNILLEGNMKQGAANENLQQLITIRDTTTGIASQEWVTLYTYKNRYLNNTYQLRFTADVRDINADVNDFRYMIGIEAGTYGFTNQYHLPFSELSVNRGYAGLYGHYRLFRNSKSHQVVMKGNVKYETAFNNRMQLNSESLVAPVTGDGTFKRGTYDIATNVLVPDFVTYGAGVMKLSLSAVYSFPIQLKNTRLVAFTKAFVQTQQTDTDKSWNSAGISIGIYP